MEKQAPFTQEQEERIREIIREERRERVEAREQFKRACLMAYHRLNFEDRPDKKASIPVQIERRPLPTLDQVTIGPGGLPDRLYVDLVPEVNKNLRQKLAIICGNFPLFRLIFRH